jgi:hypothetical protein
MRAGGAGMHETRPYLCASRNCLPRPSVSAMGHYTSLAGCLQRQALDGSGRASGIAIEKDTYQV